MKKKKSSGGGANWQDTYGDMVTLLLCFFVLLYSMSTISEENWKALVMSFNPNADQTIREVQGGEDGPFADPPPDDPGPGLMPNPDEEMQLETDMETLFQSLVNYVKSMNMEGSIAVSQGQGKVFVTFNQSVFFDGDDWELREESKPILENVGKMLSQVEKSVSEVRVMGHTAQADPNCPNTVNVDRNLSARRAATALAYIQQNCTVDPARMISEGYGQWRPVALNDTEEHRAQNRRVEMVISAKTLEDGQIKDSFQEYYTERENAAAGKDSAAAASEGTSSNTSSAEGSGVSGAPAG